MMNGLQQKIFRRDEVRVEDGDEFALRCLHPLGQRAGLEAFAIGAMKIADGKTLGGVMLN